MPLPQNKIRSCIIGSVLLVTGALPNAFAATPESSCAPGTHRGIDYTSPYKKGTAPIHVDICRTRNGSWLGWAVSGKKVFTHPAPDDGAPVVETNLDMNTTMALGKVMENFDPELMRAKQRQEQRTEQLERQCRDFHCTYF